MKETREELSITITNPLFLLKDRVRGEHNFFASIFFKVLPKDTPFVFDENEIQNFKRLSKEVIDEWLETIPEELHPSFNHLWNLVHRKLKELNLI
ncbi:MAG: hypothetical protein LBH96_00410 [Candidatus Peribacteria bacterium]|jgi:hypothetical protein|nr:hypothetical protein [Candidatus Peribacteria bacterium]